MNTKFEDFFLSIQKIIVGHAFTFYENTWHNFLGGRNAYGVVHLLSGRLEYHFTDGKVLHFSAGDTILLKPNDAYKIYCHETCLHYTVNFTIDERSIEGEFTKSLFHSKETACVRQPVSQNFYAERLQELCAVWEKKKAGYHLHALAILYQVLARFIHAQLPSKQNSAYLKIKPAKEYIETQWNKLFTLNDLSAVCYLSTAHFRHAFKEIFGMSPMDYRNSLRLLHAKDYLAQGILSVTEIAYQCGFDSVNYFSRFFKKHTGISPTQYAMK